METASAAAAQCRILCFIHNIPHEDSAAEQWVRTVLEPDFHVDHCQRIEGKSARTSTELFVCSQRILTLFIYILSQTVLQTRPLDVF